VFKATPRPLYPHEDDPISIVEDAGWAPGPVWTGAENLASTGIRSPDPPAHYWHQANLGLLVFLLLLLLFGQHVIEQALK
jgi:hypothetical protein